MDVRNKRMSFSSARNESPVDVTTFNADSDEWIKAWEEVPARGQHCSTTMPAYRC